MKNLVNEYYFENTYDEHLKIQEGALEAVHEKRNYNTKMHVGDLPEHYCVVNRYNTFGKSAYNAINSKIVKDLYYTWVKENHFMKDSMLRVSFSGPIEKYHPINLKTGKEEWWDDYKNADSHIFGFEIFKFLAYAKHYSNFDITGIRNEFVKQCEWLNINEPAFAPTLKDGQTYVGWFDETVAEYENKIV